MEGDGVEDDLSTEVRSQRKKKKNKDFFYGGSSCLPHFITYMGLAGGSKHVF